MDPGRYGLRQGWENNSALKGYGAVHDSDFRDSGSYDDRRFIDEGFSRENSYPRGAFHRDVLERDNYHPPPSSAGMWPQTRRRSNEEEYSFDRDDRWHEKPYVVSYYTGYMGQGGVTPALTVSTSSTGLSLTESSSTVTPFITDASALGSYAQSRTAGSGKRRFSEMPSTSVGNKEQSQTTYRDRAAERRSLYGSSSAFGDDSNARVGDSMRKYRGLQDGDPMYRRGVLDSIPFPPGVGGARSTGDSITSYEVITADKAIDKNNVGNQMLRSMGWHEGTGLGKDGSGMVEPVQAQATETRAGLGIHQPKKMDPSLDVQAGDGYKAVIKKKAIARFREMSVE